MHKYRASDEAMRMFTRILLLSILMASMCVPCRAIQDPGPFDLAFDRGRVLIHMSPRTSTLLSLQGDYLQLFYYNRSLDRFLPPGYPKGVYAGFYDSAGRLHRLDLYDDGQHLDGEKGDGIFANYAVGTLDDLTLHADHDEFFIDTELDTLGVRVQVLTVPYKSVPMLPRMLVPAEGAFPRQQVEASLMIDPLSEYGALFVTRYDPQISVLSRASLWRQPLPTNATGQILTVPFAPPVVTGERYYVGLWTVSALSLSSPIYSLDLTSFVVDSSFGLASSFEISQNYPNPFNSLTFIVWKQEAVGPISLHVFNVAGRLIRTLLPPTTFSAGMHSSMWDGCDQTGNAVSNGAYFLVARSATVQRTKKLIFLR